MNIPTVLYDIKDNNSSSSGNVTKRLKYTRTCLQYQKQQMFSIQQMFVTGVFYLKIKDPMNTILCDDTFVYKA